MQVTRLEARGLRGFEQVTLAPEPGLNLITGDNGAGKTSLLEALHLMAYGRSFRGRVRDGLVRTRSDAVEVFVEWRKLFVNERNAMEAIRGSVWQAFNTVTEWHDHERGRSGDNTDARVHSNLFGVSHVAKQKTLKLALALAAG